MKWTSIHEGRPEGDKPYIVWTKNNKVMSVRSRKLDDWFINKYSVTHWMILDPPQDSQVEWQDTLTVAAHYAENPHKLTPPEVYNFIKQLSMDGVVPVQLGESMDQVALRRFKIRIDQAKALLKWI